MTGIPKTLSAITLYVYLTNNTASIIHLSVLCGRLNFRSINMAGDWTIEKPGLYEIDMRTCEFTTLGSYIINFHRIFRGVVRSDGRDNV